ncbi:MAG: CDC48 family AAA ATPase [Candidatus Diapherotrites archaeon]|nr:CDC48 family AAA ATPase [Candidatus Diapherotrites archaeon]
MGSKKRCSKGEKEIKEEIELTVGEAYKMDAGRGVVRMSTNAMKSLGIVAGDAVLIKGAEEALAIVWRAHNEDEEKDIIRLDNVLRSNAKVSVGDKVVVKKVELEEAKSVTLAPLEEVRFSGDPTHYFHDKLMEKAIMKNSMVAIDVMGTTLHYIVTNLQPKCFAKIVPETKIVISEKRVKAEAMKIPSITYENVGGLKEEISMIREMVELPMRHPEVFERIGISAPKGVLLTGPPGCGKTLLAKAVANESEANFYAINGPEVMSKWYGESEKRLRDIFEEAEKNAPSIIFIDEIDAIAPKREEVTGEVERRVVAQLLTLMDGLKSRGNVVVIAATNRPEALDEALRRPGRFDREIAISVPDQKARKEILQIHTRGMPLAKDVDLDKLSEITIGYTGADLEVLSKEAAMKALRKYIPEFKKYEEKIPTEILEKLEVRMKDFLEAYKKIEPSAMREVMIQKPNVKWSDIGGLENVKSRLKEIIEWPLKKPELFKKAGIKPAKGILLYGPPGTGKTLLAKAVANESEANFIAVKGPEIISKWVGESERNVRKIFRKARQVAPSIIFFDEFDAISQVRGASLTDATERVINQLLTELDGIEELEKVVVIAATNRPELIDKALLRPGRIDVHIEIPMPDEKERLEILKVHTRNMPLAKDVNVIELAADTNGFSGADIAAICREAGMNAIRQAMRKNTQQITISEEHFRDAIAKIAEMKGSSNESGLQKGAT